MRGPQPGRIRIEFIKFRLEYDAACRYDFVEIREGEVADSPVVGKFCGTTLPAVYESTGNMVWIQFRSDPSASDEGFKLQWTWKEGNDGDSELDQAVIGGEFIRKAYLCYLYVY